MAEKNEHSKNEQNTSQHLKKANDAQHPEEHHMNSGAENFTTNKFSKFGYVPEDDRKIYIGGLKEEITEKDLSEHFGKFGDIKYIDLKVDTATGRSRGFAFIVFKTKEGMDNTLVCNKHLINDMKIEPKKAIPQRIKYFVGGQHLNSAAENFTTNNSCQFGYVPEEVSKIYIGGLKEEITEKDLSEHFGKFGEIKNIDLKVDIATGRSRGYAFVMFKLKGGMDNALAFNNHVINDMKIEPKKAIPQRIKLFVGGLRSRMTYDDIKNYFKRYTPHLIVDMPFDRVKNKRKGFCFVTIEDLEAVTEILRLPRHVIKEKQVDVNVADVGLKNKIMMLGASESMNLLQGNVMDQGGFLPQAGYALHAFGYHYGSYNYYQPYTEYSPSYHYSYSYPSYVAGAEAGNQFEGNEASGVNGNQIVELEVNPKY